MKKSKLTTINDVESKKFSKFSSEWWKTDGEFKPLHLFNKIRIEFILRSLKENNKIKFSSLKGINILDIGCGGGILCESLAKLGASVTGIDVSKNAIEAAKLHAKKKS